MEEFVRSVRRGIAAVAPIYALPNGRAMAPVAATAEKARLKKEIEGLEKAIASKERQLGDETFRSRAPEKIIKGLEATLAGQRIELQKLKDRLSQLEKGS